MTNEKPRLSTRGFAQFDPVPTDTGAKVTLFESSCVGEATAWFGLEGVELSPHEPDRAYTRLTGAQARQLAQNLLAFADYVEAPDYWRNTPEYRAAWCDDVEDEDAEDAAEDDEEERREFGIGEIAEDEHGGHGLLPDSLHPLEVLPAHDRVEEMRESGRPARSDRNASERNRPEPHRFEFELIAVGLLDVEPRPRTHPEVIVRREDEGFAFRGSLLRQGPTDPTVDDVERHGVSSHS